MKHLRQEVQKRLHETLDGRRFDLMEWSPRLPNMLGICPIKATCSPEDKRGTLLDPNIGFWNKYEGRDVFTKRHAEEEVQSAITSLKEDGLFRLTYPYGEEGDIVYCEVEPVERNDASIQIESPCPECGAELDTSPNLELTTGSGYLNISVECRDCSFAGEYETTMYRK